MKQYANRTDTNHKLIIELARYADCVVFDVSAKKNFFDLLLLRKGKTYCVEVKYNQGELTQGEKEAQSLFEKANVKYHIVRSAFDLATILELEKHEASALLYASLRMPLSSLHKSKAYRLELKENAIKSLHKYINEL